METLLAKKLRSKLGLWTFGVLLALSSFIASAADLTPIEVKNLFTNLGDTAAALFLLAVVLFGAIRGAVAVIKISGKFFGAAGA